MGTLLPVALIGHTGHGTCYLHSPPQAYTTTFYQTPATTITVNGVEVCVVGTLGHATCGHDTIATTGSGVSGDPNGNAFHRVGDQGHIIGDAGSTYVVDVGSNILSSE